MSSLKNFEDFLRPKRKTFIESFVETRLGVRHGALFFVSRTNEVHSVLQTNQRTLSVKRDALLFLTFCRSMNFFGGSGWAQDRNESQRSVLDLARECPKKPEENLRKETKLEKSNRKSSVFTQLPIIF